MSRRMCVAATVITAVVCSASFVRAAELPGALMDPYIAVQTALAADQMDPIAGLAARIEAAAAALGSEATAMVAGAKRLAEATDLGPARAAFGEISEALLAYAQTTNSDLPAGVQLAYCPMANKSWLQRDKEIRNPYYGSAMLTCGNFKN